MCYNVQKNVSGCAGDLASDGFKTQKFYENSQYFRLKLMNNFFVMAIKRYTRS